ncbi:MAG TPA: hypothetical protein VNQ79_29160 [Blastocatellia bacterium]|nr:hypothetical protein [Blastocatellia bacterium]
MIFAFLAGALCVWLIHPVLNRSGAVSAKPAATTWEYIQTCNPKEMNKLGQDGWELVSATHTGVGVCLFFKRPK